VRFNPGADRSLSQGRFLGFEIARLKESADEAARGLELLRRAGETGGELKLLRSHGDVLTGLGHTHEAAEACCRFLTLASSDWIPRRRRRAEAKILADASRVAAVAKVEPLTQVEEVLWRSLMRLVVTLPRALGDDLVRARGMTANEYTTLMHLSEAPKRELGITDLAAAAALSVSRMSRLLDDLQSRGLILKRQSETDGRGNIARLTRPGLAALKSAYPEHLASVRRLVLDHIDKADKARMARVLEAVATSVDQSAMRRPM
jgi:DNA-binding MarR family transcriptional regulator